MLQGRCEEVKNCSLGYEISDYTCSCVLSETTAMFSIPSNFLDISLELIIIVVLGSSIFIMLILITLLMVKLKRVKEKLKVQESIRMIKNIDKYYQVSSNLIHKDTLERYEQVYSEFGVSESSSDNSKESPNDSDQDDLYQSIDTVRINPNRDMFNNNSYKSDFKTATEPIDQALMLLKISADQL